MLIAAVPIVSAIFAWRLGIDDRITGNRVLGLAIGIVGVASLVGLDVTGSELFSVALLGITVVGYALGPIIVSQKLSQAPALAVIAMAMVINSVIYAPLAFFSRPTESVPSECLAFGCRAWRGLHRTYFHCCSSPWWPKWDRREPP